MIHLFALIASIFAIFAYRLIRVPHPSYFTAADKAFASLMHVLAASAAGLLLFTIFLFLSI